MDRPILVVNSGSSSVKVALYDAQAHSLQAAALAERLGESQAHLKITLPHTHESSIQSPADHKAALAQILDHFTDQGWLQGAPGGIGHRVVHGGEDFNDSVRVNDQVKTAIDKCSALAPLHNPHNLAGIHALEELYPEVPQVAVFDTAFHQSLPRAAYHYALPYEFYERHGVRRYGFHGTSHRFMLSQTAALLSKPEQATSLISAHLGNGCSITAIRNGQSVDTSMGLTPLEGLVMGTRSGDIDPSLFEFLAQRGFDAAELNRILNRESGLLGLSGISNDMRTLLEKEQQGNDRARLAVDVFCFRLARYIGAMMSSLSHLDALVFTGGIGENSTEVRTRTLERLTLLGFRIDPVANERHGRDTDGAIGAADSHRILVLPTDEEKVIARDTLRLISE
ncbi:acetate kinase [Marinobacteraceae bacterium S3BR75-40.1]